MGCMGLNMMHELHRIHGLNRGHGICGAAAASTLVGRSWKYCLAVKIKEFTCRVNKYSKISLHLGVSQGQGGRGSQSQRGPQHCHLHPKWGATQLQGLSTKGLSSALILMLTERGKGKKEGKNQWNELNLPSTRRLQ